MIFPEFLEIRGTPVKRQNIVKYLGIQLDAGLRWKEHISFIKTRAKYVNILKWLRDRTWGIDPLQSMNFVNATILAQLSWGSLWYMNAAKTVLKTLDSLLTSVYKFVLGLPKGSANTVCWSLLNLPSLNKIITKKSDGFICRAF